MEAAPRPSREPLPDLPVEEPEPGAVPIVKPAQGASAGPADATQTVEFLNPELLDASEEAPAAAAPAPEAEKSTESTQTLLKPEFLLAADEPPAAAAAAAPEPEAHQVLDVDPDAPLSLEDTFEVDKMLSAPPPAPSKAPPAAPARMALAAEEPLTLLPESGAASSRHAPDPARPVRASASSSTTAKSAEAAPPAAPALVPLARRASLSAAAMKLAAASTAKPPKPAAPPAAVAPLKPRAPAEAPAPATPTPKPPASAAPSSPAAPEAPPAPAAPAAPAATPPADAPSLASWANARAAASAKAASSPARANTSAVKPATPAPAEKRRSASSASSSSSSAKSAASSAVPAQAAAAASSAPRGMDRDFIARNQVVERYLSGKLPIKAATDFERYCKEHPQLLDEMGLPERVNAGLRLLEASGKPEPWQEASRPIWQQPVAMLGLAGFATVLALSLAIVAASSSSKSRKILDLQRQVVERTLDAATSTRIIRLLPNRSGASNTPAIVIGGRDAQLIDFRIDESRSPYKDFRVTIDRIDQGRVMIIDNLAKDSNGHLRVAVNSSAFGPGNYLLTIEGLTMRLEPQPDSWVTIGIAQR